MNTKEIRAKYLVLHNALGTRQEALDKDLFDQQHGKVWADCDTELKARKAELIAIAVPTVDEQKELAELKLQFPDVIGGRNPFLEIDELKARIALLGIK